jgi:hypothetical protein
VNEWTKCGDIGLVFVNAHIDNNGFKEFLQNKAPNWQPAKFAPQTMIPSLNEYGKKGWELVHMQPVDAGINDDIHFGDANSWSNTYFCVFKRRIKS